MELYTCLKVTLGKCQRQGGLLVEFVCISYQQYIVWLDKVVICVAMNSAGGTERRLAAAPTCTSHEIFTTSCQVRPADWLTICAICLSNFHCIWSHASTTPFQSRQLKAGFCDREFEYWEKEVRLPTWLERNFDEDVTRLIRTAGSKVSKSKTCKA